jgi:hypothetical protein
MPSTPFAYPQVISHADGGNLYEHEVMRMLVALSIFVAVMVLLA